MSNVEECKRYKRKCDMIGVDSFTFEVNEQNDNVKLLKNNTLKIGDEYRELNKYRLVIPDFVTSISDIQDAVDEGDALWDEISVDKISVVWKNCQCDSIENLFGSNLCKEIDISEMNTERVKNMSYLFIDSAVERVVWGDFNTSNVKIMRGMFYRCECLKHINMDSIDLSNVEDMSLMFSSCFSLRDIIIDSNIHSVRTMMGMFDDCKSLERVRITCKEKTSIKSMYGLANKCNALRDLDLSTLYLEDSANIGDMLYYCDELRTVKMPKMSQVMGAQGLFRTCKNLRYVEIDKSFYNRVVEGLENRSLDRTSEETFRQYMNIGHAVRIKLR